MRKALIVIHYPVFGGPHNQVLRLNNALKAMGWEITVLLPDEPGNASDRLRSAGVKTRTISMQRLRASRSPRIQWQFLRRFAGDVRRIREVIRQGGFDIVSIGGLANPHAAIAARREGVPVVWQVLDISTPQPLIRLLMPFVRRTASSVLVTGHAVAEHHRGLASFGDRLFAYFPPVDVEEFRRDEIVRSHTRKLLGIAEGAFVVGTISNVNPDKDLLTFVAAAGRLAKTTPDVVFVILGEQYPQHSDYAERLLRSAEQHGLTPGESLILFSPISEVARYAMTFDLFWLTSRAEGLPTVIGEAMALGLPVVATDVGATREAVIDGSTGFVVDVGDYDEIAAVSRRIIERVEDRERMSERAAADAARKFGVETCAGAFRDAFEAALAEGNSNRANR